MAFLDDLQKRPLIGDGAMGTELLAAGAPRGACLEELCVRAQEMVQAVHRSYLAAGARLLRTNSFGANAVRLAAHGCEHRVGELNWTAAQLARDCARGSGAVVAGSVGPLGPEGEGVNREGIFIEQIGALLDGGAQLIFLETFTDLGELLLAVHAKHSLHHCPVIASLACDAAGRVPDGATLGEAWARLRSAEADVVGINCLDPAAALSALDAAVDDPGPIAVFPSAGLPRERDGRLEYPIDPATFAGAGRRLLERGVRLLGGCCGAGPTHIAALGGV
jgi:homocysteine S-methyltransferase